MAGTYAPYIVIVYIKINVQSVSYMNKYEIIKQKGKDHIVANLENGKKCYCNMDPEQRVYNRKNLQKIGFTEQESEQIDSHLLNIQANIERKTKKLKRVHHLLPNVEERDFLHAIGNTTVILYNKYGQYKAEYEGNLKWLIKDCLFFKYTRESKNHKAVSIIVNLLENNELNCQNILKETSKQKLSLPSERHCFFCNNLVLGKKRINRPTTNK